MKKRILLGLHTCFLIVSCTSTQNTPSIISSKIADMQPTITEGCKAEMDKAHLPQKAVYPITAKRDRKSGSLVLEYSLDESGKAVDIRPVLTTDPQFNQAAVDSINTAHFLIPNDWLATCGKQRFWIGYSFGIGDFCGKQQFPGMNHMMTCARLVESTIKPVN